MNIKKEIHLLPFMEAGRIEAGCDEAGRGPLAGPVYAAAVILPADFYHPLLNDSKKMSEKSRDILRPIFGHPLPECSARSGGLTLNRTSC